MIRPRVFIAALLLCVAGVAALVILEITRLGLALFGGVP